MSRSYSLDLRERVVAAMEKGSLSSRHAAKQFGVGGSTAIRWVERLAADRQRCARQDGRP
jgi:transposase